MFALAWDGCVEGEADEFDLRQFMNALEHCFALFAVRLDVELPAEDLVFFPLYDLLRGLRSIVGDDLHRTIRPARLRNPGFAIFVAETSHRGRADEEGNVDLVAEEGGRGVAARAVDEDARTHEDGAVDGVVEGFGDEVVAGGEVIAPCFAADLLRGQGFDVVDIEAFFEGVGRVICLFLGGGGVGSAGLLRGLL